MTIQRKRINVSNTLLEVETDSTDTVDPTGFSDAISTVSSKTAKFTGGAIMKANSGLRIGLTQLKIVAGAAPARTRSVNSSSNITEPEKTIDDNTGTIATLTTQPGTGIVDIDFQVSANAVANTTVNVSNSGQTNVTVNLLTSTDDVSYTLRQTQTFINFTGGLTTLSSPTAINYRYIRVEMIIAATPPPSVAGIAEIFESSLSETAQINIRSSDTQDTNDGTIILANKTITAGGTTGNLTTDLLLTGLGKFVTLEIISFAATAFTNALVDVVSIKEV